LALTLASHELGHFSENFGENDLVRGRCLTIPRSLTWASTGCATSPRWNTCFSSSTRSCAPIFHHLPRPLKAGSANQVYLRPYISK